jgi:imidazolonepropionase
LIDADLAVLEAAELVTCRGPAPRAGSAQAEAGVLRNASLAAREGRIVFVGAAGDFRRRVRLAPAAEVIEARGRVVLPGFVDCHTHLPFAGDRLDDFLARLGGASYAEIAARGGGILTSVRAARAASRAELAGAALPYLDRMLLSGTTTCEAKSGYGLRLEDEIRQLEAVAELDRSHPVDLVPTFLGAHAVPPEFSGRAGDYVEAVCGEMVPEVARRGLARFCDVFCERGAFSPEQARRVLEAGAAAGLRPKIHADQMGDGGGAALAAALGAVSADHLEHVGERGIAALARCETVAVLLPIAPFFLRDSRQAPARKLIEAGVPVALATDLNPGTAFSESMPLALSLGCLLAGLAPDEAIVGATLNAASACGCASDRGSLEEGKIADLAILGAPRREHLVYHPGVNLCTDVVKRGRAVVRDGRRVEVGRERPAAGGPRC